MPDTDERIANDANGAKLREGTRVEYVGRGPMRGRTGHVIKVYAWNPNGPQTVECIDADGASFVGIGRNLRRVR
jgi:hypothetical protein